MLGRVLPENFIYPLFLHTKDSNEKITSMPGCERHSVDSVMREVGEAIAEGVTNVILFPKIPEDVKTNAGRPPRPALPAALTAALTRFSCPPRTRALTSTNITCSLVHQYKY